MPDTYSTDALIGVIAGLKEPMPSMLARYFALTAQDDSETIHFDLLKSKRRIAPFVSPLVAGRIVNEQTYQTKTFTPAYIKPKTPFDPTRPFKRQPGEQIGGSLSAQQRRDAAVASHLTDLIGQITRRLEWMAVAAVRTGSYVVEGDGYPAVSIDFGRHTDLEPAALTGTDLWTDAASVPLDFLADLAATALRLCGVAPNDLILGTEAWKAFRAHASIAARLDTRRVSGNGMDVGATFQEGLTFRGDIDGFRVFTYAGWYVDPADDTEKELWPANVAGLASGGLEGVRFYGAIKDPRAGYQAMPYFPKMWIDEDPPVEWLMVQSAPLIVPQRVDGAVSCEVVEMPPES